MIDDENQYTAIRSQLLNEQTNLEHQKLSRIAKLDDGDQPTVNQKKQKWDRCLIVHYNHERRFATLGKDVHQLWEKLFQATSITDTRLIIGHRNNRNMKRELIHNRPMIQKEI